MLVNSVGMLPLRRFLDTSLLVRNIPRDCRPDELRIPFERFGPLKDVYLPKDYYSGGRGVLPSLSECFIEKEVELDMYMRGNFEMIPFGTGRRECPSASLAISVEFVQFDEFSKMVYLDDDIEVFDNIDNLFERPNGYSYAVMDCFCEKTWSRTTQYKIGYCQQCPNKVTWPAELEDERPALYFNAGTFVFEPSKWKL